MIGLELASLHSDAVDYVKTGVPADMPRSLRIRKYPHFMEKEKEKSYTSYKILGQLYDKVQRIDFVPSYELSFDERILKAYTPSEEMLEAARELKGDYDSALHSIMAQHEIHTEFEVYSTFVIHHSQAAGDYKFHEEIGNIRDGLKEIWQKAVIHRVGSNDELKLGPFVAAMYTVTKQELDAGLDDLKARKAKGRRRERYVEGMPLEFTPEDVKAMPLISFPWLFARILGKIAKREYPFNTEILGQNDVSEVGCCTQVIPHRHHTAADDFVGFETIPAEESSDDSSSYQYFDYSEQSDECEVVGNDTDTKQYTGHTSDGDGSSSSGIPKRINNAYTTDDKHQE